MKKIYTISAINFTLDNSLKSNTPNTIIYFGYFSNLKKVYSVLSGNSLPSYSKVARDVKKSELVIIENTRIFIDGGYVKMKKITLNTFEINKLNRERKNIDFESIALAEIYKGQIGNIKPII